MKWIKLPDQTINGRIVHEIKCPVCKYRMTFHDNRKPDKCYCCETRMKGVETK